MRPPKIKPLKFLYYLNLGNQINNESPKYHSFIFANYKSASAANKTLAPVNIERIFSDATLSSFTENEICRYAVTNIHFGMSIASWDNRSMYSEFVAEAKKRGYSVDSCEHALGH